MNFKDFIKTVDDDSNKKGDQFEKFCKWFLENDPVWKPQVKIVWLWNDWPERWGADLGIDLVFEHTNGEIWAVQSKCYGEDISQILHSIKVIDFFGNKIDIPASDIKFYYRDSNLDQNLIITSVKLKGKIF